MATSNFMEAGTEIQGLLDKKKQILIKVSNEIATACVTRARSNSVNENIVKDVFNLIEDFPLEDQRDILLMVSYKSASQISGTNKSSNNSRSGRNNMNDIFSSRNF